MNARRAAQFSQFRVILVPILLPPNDRLYPYWFPQLRRCQRVALQEDLSFQLPKHVKRALEKLAPKKLLLTVLLHIYHLLYQCLFL